MREALKSLRRKFCKPLHEMEQQHAHLRGVIAKGLNEAALSTELDDINECPIGRAYQLISDDLKSPDNARLLVAFMALAYLETTTHQWFTALDDALLKELQNADEPDPDPPEKEV